MKVLDKINNDASHGDGGSQLKILVMVYGEDHVKSKFYVVQTISPEVNSGRSSN